MGSSSKDLEHLGFTSTRRFGIEIELNSFDGKSKPETEGKVAGIDYVAKVCHENSEEGAEVRAWEHTNNNAKWVIKPDSSCGMEICTPPLSGWKGINKICRVVNALGKDPKVKADKRCSVHVHIDLSDLDEEQIARVLAWYIKCEPVIMDAVPEYRKINKYCQFIGMTASLSHEVEYSSQDLIHLIGEMKYYSMNAKALCSGNRRTLEFRIIEGDGCKDAYLIKNWTRFLLHFIDRAIGHPLKMKHDRGNQWTGLVWLDPEDVFRFLGFSLNPQYEYQLSKGLQQTRNWFMARLIKFMDHKEKGPRAIASREFHNMLSKFREVGIEINLEEHLSPKELETVLYDESYKY